MKEIALMISGSAFFTLNDAAMKLALAELSYGRAISVRGVASCGIIFFIVIFRLRTRRIVWGNVQKQIGAALLFIAASFLYVYSLPLLSLPVAVTAVYTAPLFAVPLAWYFLGEKVSVIRALATATGFIGVFLAVGARNSFSSWAVLLPLLSAFAIAVRDIKLRELFLTEGSFSILIYHQVGLTLFGMACALSEGPNASTTTALPYLIAASASVGSMLGVFLIIESFRVSDVSSVSPLRYTAILWAALLGYFLWGDSIEVTQMMGMLLVILSGTIVALSTSSKVPAARG